MATESVYVEWWRVSVWTEIADSKLYLFLVICASLSTSGWTCVVIFNGSFDDFIAPLTRFSLLINQSISHSVRQSTSQPASVSQSVSIKTLLDRTLYSFNGIDFCIDEPINHSHWFIFFLFNHAIIQSFMSLFIPLLVLSLQFISSTWFIFDFIHSSTYSVPVFLLTTLRDVAEFPAFLQHRGVTPGFLFLCTGVATIVLRSQQLRKHQGRPLMLLGVVVCPCLAHQAGRRHVDCAVVPASFVHVTLLCGTESCSKGKSSSANVTVIAIITSSLPLLWSLTHNHCLLV